MYADLSFNNIEVIEGLDKLTKLEDLTLYNNRIQKLEGMDALTQLHVFSVGNNDIKDLDGSVSNINILNVGIVLSNELTNVIQPLQNLFP